MKKNLSYFGGSHHYVISSVLLVGQVGLIHLQLGWETIYYISGMNHQVGKVKGQNGRVGINPLLSGVS